MTAPMREVLERACRDAVAEEFGSQLCGWIDIGTKRVCRKAMGSSVCICESIGNAILAAIDAAGGEVMPKKLTAEMLSAAEADEASKVVNGILAMAAVRGIELPAKYCVDGNYPLQRWYAALRAANPFRRGE